MTVATVEIPEKLLRRAKQISGKRSTGAVLRYALKQIAEGTPTYPPDDGPPDARTLTAIRRAFPQKMSRDARHLFDPE